MSAQPRQAGHSPVRTDDAEANFMSRAKYTVLQILYWANAAVLFGFTVSFLRSYGFSNGEAGTICALSNLLGLAGTIFLGLLLDRKKIHLYPLLIFALFMQAIAISFLFLHAGHSAVTAVCFITSMAISLMVNPLYIKLSVNLNHAKNTVNFGLSRGAGSLSFAFSAWLTGILIQDFSVAVVPFAALTTVVPQLFIIFTAKGGFAEMEKDTAAQNPGISLFSFFMGHPLFVVLILGIAALFAANNTINNFLIVIVNEAGGNYATLGALTFFLALVEFPAMLLYSRQKKRRSSFFLRISFLFFAIKIFAFALSKSVPALFLSAVFQSLSFGLYTPAVVDYINEVIPYEDSAKAQSLASAMAAVGTMIATYASGFMLDRFPVKAVLLALTVVAVFGAGLSIWGTKREK